MGKKEDKKRLKKVIDNFIFNKKHLYDIACEFDNFVDIHNLPFEGLEVVGSNYVTYLSNDNNNFRIKIFENNIQFI